MDAIQDPKNYKKLSKPFASRMDAASAMTGFIADVIKARQKWKIADAVVVAGVRIEGEEDQLQVLMQEFGHSVVSTGLLHKALGKSLEGVLSAAKQALDSAEAANSEEEAQPNASP